MINWKYRNKAVLLLAFSSYLSLAIGGLFYGLPDAGHTLSYVCDETIWLEALSTIKPAEKKFNPHPYLTHPMMYFTMYAAGTLVASELGWIPLNKNKEWFLEHIDVFGRLYLVQRIIQVLCGFLLLWMMWLFVRNAFGESIALLSVLLFSVNPALVSTSHFGQASLPVALFGFISFAFLMVGTDKSPPMPRNFFWSCFFFGLAVSTKLSALALLAPIAFYAVRLKCAPRTLFLGIVAVIVGFVVGSPFSVLAPHTFWDVMRMHVVDNQRPVGFSLDGWIFPIWIPYRFALGTPLFAVSLAAIVYSFFHWKGTKIQLLLIWIAGFYLATVRVGLIATVPRILIAIPMIFILIAFCLMTIKDRVQLRESVFVPLVGILFISSLFYSGALVALRWRTPLQKQASQWIVENIPFTKSIGIPRDPFWYTPDIVYKSWHHPERMEKVYPIVNLHYSVETAQKEKPDYIVMSEIERTRCEEWDMPSGCKDLVSWITNEGSYHVLKKFERKVSLFGIEWNRPEYEQYPAYDDDDLKASSIWIYQKS